MFAFLLAATLTLPALPPAGHADCEAATNVALKASAEQRGDRINLLLRRLSESSTPEESRLAEDAILSELESIDVHVSTNVVDDSVGIDLIRQNWTRRIGGRLNLSVFPTNASACLSLARYVGNVKRADYPSDLVQETLPVPIMRSLNGHRIPEERLRRLEMENERRCERRRELGERCEIQIRVFLANASVEEYRRSLLTLCGKSVVGCRGVMDDEEFALFTNQVVSVSGATEQERSILFRDLANALKTPDGNGLKTNGVWKVDGL